MPLGRRLLRGGLAGLVLLSLAGPARAQAAGDAPYAAAVELLAAGKFPEATAAFEKFLADFPNHARAVPARLHLGAALLGSAKPGPAAAAFEKALAGQLPPDLRREALHGLGRARHAAGEFPTALEPLTEAARLSVQDSQHGPPIRMLLGEVLQRVGRPAEAARVFDELQQRWPTHALAPQAYFQVAESYRLAGNHLEAAVTFRNVADRHWRLSLAPLACLGAADSFLALGRLDEAEREYRRVLQEYIESPPAPRAQIGLGRVAYARRDFPSARSAFQAAGVVFGGAIVPLADLRVADTYRAEGKWEEAEKRYRALLGAAEREIAREARYSLGVTLQADGKPAPAAAEFTALAGDADAGRWRPLARVRLAEIRAAAGETAPAVAALREVLAAAPEADIRDEAAAVLGEVHLRARDFAAAEAEFAGLLQRGPDGPQAGRAQVGVAEARLGLGKPAEAAAAATEALKRPLPPDLRAAGLTQLGLAQLRLKQNAEGTASLREVLEKHAAAPAAPVAARALLAHFRESNQPGPAAEMERLLVARYGGAAAPDAELIARAEGLLAADPAEARRLLTDALGRGPDRPSRLRVRAGLAEACAALGLAPEAAAHLAELAKDTPPAGALAAAHWRAGQGWERRGAKPAAVAAYRAARAAGPDAEGAPRVLLRLGRLLAEDRPTEAEEPLRELLAKHAKATEVPEALYELAWVLQDQGQAEAARPVLVRLAEEHRTHPLAADAAFRLGEHEYRAGNYPAAAARYRAAAAAGGPIAASAGYKLGWALRQQGDHDGAAQSFLAAAKAAPQGPLAPECRLRAGEALLEQEKEEDALPLFEALLAGPGATREEREVQLQARVGAAWAHLLAGRPEKAAEVAAEVALPANGWYGGRAQLARAEAVFLKEGPAAALVEFQRGAGLFGRYRDLAAEATFRAAECHEKLGNGGAARAAWQKVVDVYPGTPWADRSRQKLAERPPAAAG